MKEITKAQEDILKTLWEIKEGAVSDVRDKLSEPKPAYNTVATVIKVLEKKEYVTHKTFGKTNVYYPLVTKNAYVQSVMKNALKGFFDGSLNQLVTAFVRNRDVSVSELEELKCIIEEEINKQNK